MARQKKWCSKLSFRGNKYTKCRIGPSSTVTSEVRNTPSPISASGKNLSPGFGQFDQFSASTRNIIILSLEILSSVIKFVLPVRIADLKFT